MGGKGEQKGKKRVGVEKETKRYPLERNACVLGHTLRIMTVVPHAALHVCCEKCICMMLQNRRFSNLLSLICPDLIHSDII
jgi:hypothetical protein